METTQSVYSYDANQGHDKGHDEIYMRGGGDELRPNFDHLKYRSDRASASVKDFFEKIDGDRDEKGSQYSSDDEKSDNGVR